MQTVDSPNVSYCPDNRNNQMFLDEYSGNTTENHLKQSEDKSPFVFANKITKKIYDSETVSDECFRY